MRVWQSTHVIARFKYSFHILVHVVMVQCHEQRINDDAECDEELYEWIKDQQGDVLLNLEPKPTAIPDAKDVDTTKHSGQQLVLERRFFIVVCRKVIGRNCNAR